MKLLFSLTLLAVAQVSSVQADSDCTGLSAVDCDNQPDCTFGQNVCQETVLGEFSVVRLGKNNQAPGDFSNVGGGEENSAGETAQMPAMSSTGTYSSIGGGTQNFPNGKNAVISGGKKNKIVEEMASDERLLPTSSTTISGGLANFILNGAQASVLTGGNGNTANGALGVVSGGKTNIVGSLDGHTITGGTQNKAGLVDNIGEKQTFAVVTGGTRNEAFGTNSFVMGGQDNKANGANSFAMGEKATAETDSSGVINLIKDLESESSAEGQLLMIAESFKFQVGPNVNDSNPPVKSITINGSNIQNLIDALN